MTNEDIEGLIDSLNEKKSQELIFMSELTKTVDYAKVWTREPRGEGGDGSFSFYFIKNEYGIYVAAVSDMYKDLHVFVKESHRKRGHLSKAMNEAILPHLFSEERDVQEITFRDPEIGGYVVRNWGFTLTSDTTARKDLSYFAGNGVAPMVRKVSIEEFSLIKEKIYKARMYLIMAAEHLESMLGKGNDADLREYASDVYALDDVVQSYIEKQQGSLL
jgi:hypothetical protein